MHALVKAALGATLLALAGLAFPKAPPAAPVPSATNAVKSAPPLVEMPCPNRQVPEGQACLPLPPLGGEVDALFRERKGRGVAFDVLPRRPDRPSDPARLRYPLASEVLVLRGFDNAQPGDVSPMSVELAIERGTVVSALSLDGQLQPTRVASMDRLVGNTVITSHLVMEADRERTLLLVHGHLDAYGPDISKGNEVAGDALLGFVGDSGNPGFVSLYLEARLVREDAGDITRLDARRLTSADISVPTDLRNVLPLAP